MDELIKLVAQKTGISEANAKTAVETVLNFLKTKLPAPIAAQLDAALQGSDVTKKAGDALKGVGGLLGRK
jgi:uncharacterized protein (DUF2267 family)